MPVLQAAVVAVCGYGVAAGRVTPGELLAALGYAATALGALERVDALLALAQARAGARRVAEVVGQAVDTAARAPAVPCPPDGPGALRIRDVTVLAHDGTPILDHIDLDVPAGALVALVGRSGSGKTTLAALPGRLVEPDSGEVLIDGRSVSTMDDLALRASVAYAFGQPVLLGGTVADAIGYGGATPSPTWVGRAAAIARADPFVRQLPAGYDTPMAEVPLSGGEVQRLGLVRALAQDAPVHATALSGGERQLLTLARAYLSPARVVLLDEATCLLDPAAEERVESAFAARPKTLVVVAHRMSSALRADRVLLLDAGQVWLGTHAELAERSPRYAELLGYW